MHMVCAWVLRAVLGTVCVNQGTAVMTAPSWPHKMFSTVQNVGSTHPVEGLADRTVIAGTGQIRQKPKTRKSIQGSVNLASVHAPPFGDAPAVAPTFWG